MTGDAPQKASVSYIRDCCEVMKPFFSSISIEVFALTTDEYAMLVDVGVDGLTLFQETYNEPLYRTLHPIGPKKDFLFRIEAPERGAMAGMRSVNIGALLGLDPWGKGDLLYGPSCPVAGGAFSRSRYQYLPSKDAAPCRKLSARLHGL